MAEYRHMKDKNAEKPKHMYQVHNSLVSYYLLVMFSFFTLFLTNQYSSARRDKFFLFLGLTGGLLVFGTIAYLIGRRERKREGLNTERFLIPLSVTDIAFFCFYGFAATSAIFSPHSSDTFMAYVGRNNGMLLLTAYLVAYLIITRMYVYKDYVIAVYLIFSCIIAGLTVINFFYLDPLGLLKGYGEKVAVDFGSTIGNKNTIASYMSLFTPVAIMTMVVNNKRYMRIIAGVALIFAYAGVLSSNSSSVILGLMVGIPVMAIFASRKYEYLTRFMLAMAVMFAGGKALRLFSYIMDGHSKGFEFMQHFLIYDKLTYIPIALFLALYVIMLLLRKKSDKYPANAITAILITLLAAGVLGVIGAMIYFTSYDTETKLGSFEKLLRFNDKWGTHRGFMWIRSIDEYGKFDIFKKLFGYGPDMLYYVLQPYFTELASRFGDGSTDCAHNEFINYLITQGALGLLSYLTIIGSSVTRGIKKAAANPMTLTFAAAIICYAVQSTVNLYQPITTPIFFIFIAITEAISRREGLHEAEKAE